MATDINSFIDTVATYLGKTQDYFSSKTGRPDVLLMALNHAKLFAQRGQDFQRNKVTCYVPMFPYRPAQQAVPFTRASAAYNFGAAVNGVTVTVGLITYTFVNSLSGAANEVLITGGQWANYLAAAINNSGGAGTHYGVGTVANTLATATVVGSTVVATATNLGPNGNWVGVASSDTTSSWNASTTPYQQTNYLIGGAGQNMTQAQMGGADLRNAMIEGVWRPVKVNKIEHAFWRIATTGDPLGLDCQNIPNYCDQWSAQNVDFNCAFEDRPLTIVSRQALADRKRKMLDLGVRVLQNGRLWAPWGFNRWDPFVYQEGNWLYMCPEFHKAVEIKLEVSEWMKPYGYVDDEETVTHDWLLEYGSDFLLYRAISELNVFLKEDDRLSISQSKMTEAWINLTAWDSTLVTGDEYLE